MPRKPRAAATDSPKKPRRRAKSAPETQAPDLPETATARQFANLIGVRVNAVTKAIALGRLPPEVARRQPNGRFAIDVAAAKKAWIENATQETALERDGAPAAPTAEESDQDEEVSRAAREAGISEAVSIREARRLKTVYEAAIAKLKYRQASGELVPLLDAERRFAAAGLKISTAIRAIPADLLARGIEPEVVAVVEQELHRCLEKLAGR